ncbi:MAG: hypothetical protein QW463_07990, partial [Candidatus Caldarchaeum sp.]
KKAFSGNMNPVGALPPPIGNIYSYPGQGFNFGQRLNAGYYQLPGVGGFNPPTYGFGGVPPIVGYPGMSRYFFAGPPPMDESVLEERWARERDVINNLLGQFSPEGRPYTLADIRRLQNDLNFKTHQALNRMREGNVSGHRSAKPSPVESAQQAAAQHAFNQGLFPPGTFGTPFFVPPGFAYPGFAYPGFGQPQPQQTEEDKQQTTSSQLVDDLKKLRAQREKQDVLTQMQQHLNALQAAQDPASAAINAGSDIESIATYLAGLGDSEVRQRFQREFDDTSDKLMRLVELNDLLLNPEEGRKRLKDAYYERVRDLANTLGVDLNRDDNRLWYFSPIVYAPVDPKKLKFDELAMSFERHNDASLSSPIHYTASGAGTALFERLRTLYRRASDPNNPNRERDAMAYRQEVDRIVAEKLRRSGSYADIFKQIDETRQRTLANREAQRQQQRLVNEQRYRDLAEQYNKFRESFLQSLPEETRKLYETAYPPIQLRPVATTTTTTPPSTAVPASPATPPASTPTTTAAPATTAAAAAPAAPAPAPAPAAPAPAPAPAPAAPASAPATPVSAAPSRQPFNDDNKFAAASDRFLPKGHFVRPQRPGRGYFHTLCKKAGRIPSWTRVLAILSERSQYGNEAWSQKQAHHKKAILGPVLTSGGAGLLAGSGIGGLFAPSDYTLEGILSGAQLGALGGTLGALGWAGGNIIGKPVSSFLIPKGPRSFLAREALQKTLGALGAALAAFIPLRHVVKDNRKMLPWMYGELPLIEKMDMALRMSVPDPFSSKKPSGPNNLFVPHKTRLLDMPLADRANLFMRSYSLPSTPPFTPHSALLSSPYWIAKAQQSGISTPFGSMNPLTFGSVYPGYHGLFGM